MYASCIGGLFTLPWNSEKCRDKATLSLLFSSISQLGLFQLLRCDDHLVEKFVLDLPDILLVANNTSCYINTMVCACQFLVEWEGFYPLFAKHMAPLICCVFHSYHKVHSDHKNHVFLNMRESLKSLISFTYLGLDWFILSHVDLTLSHCWKYLMTSCIM